MNGAVLPTDITLFRFMQIDNTLHEQGNFEAESWAGLQVER